ncbi:MAG: MBL fold metallo-hydrolase [Lachnospiraceae bacterium]|nr:MBL fold metallo-hydrolase [Lachnospiraceae bacterium]
MAEISKLYEGTWRIAEDKVCFFLLEGSDFALLIDSGMETPNVKELAQTLTKLPIKLLNTHADGDHTGCNYQFDEFYMNPAEATNYYKNMMHPGTGTIIPVEDKDIIDLGGRPLEVVALAGHTPGSIGLIDINNRALFSGDVVQNSTVYLFGPNREMHAYILSLEKIGKMKDRFDIVYASHGDESVSPDIIEPLKKGAEDVLAHRLPSEMCDVHGMQVPRYELGVAGIYYDN